MDAFAIKRSREGMSDVNPTYFRVFLRFIYLYFLSLLHSFDHTTNITRLFPPNENGIPPITHISFVSLK